MLRTEVIRFDGGAIPIDIKSLTDRQLEDLKARILAGLPR
jgi:hypothetical protein